MRLGTSKSGGTADITDILIGTVSVDPPNILAVGMGISSARVSADNQITIRFVNPTLLGINQGAVTMAVLAIK